jgi:hypothetical protein
MEVQPRCVQKLEGAEDNADAAVAEMTRNMVDARAFSIRSASC